MIRAFSINRFRGDPALFDDGRAFIAERTGWPDLGLVPWFPDAPSGFRPRMRQTCAGGRQGAP
jgi:cobyric acid synthase